MSQVIVTNDRLNDKRARTRLQEQKIGKEELYKRWRIASPNQDKPLFAIAALAFFPIALAWIALLAVVGIAVTLFTFVLHTFGRILGQR